MRAYQKLAQNTGWLKVVLNSQGNLTLQKHSSSILKDMCLTVFSSVGHPAAEVFLLHHEVTVVFSQELEDFKEEEFKEETDCRLF